VEKSFELGKLSKRDVEPKGRNLCFYHPFDLFFIHPGQSQFLQALCYQVEATKTMDGSGVQMFFQTIEGDVDFGISIG
jgi:hypothetical protein